MSINCSFPYPDVVLDDHLLEILFQVLQAWIPKGLLSIYRAASSKFDLFDMD